MTIHAPRGKRPYAGTNVSVDVSKARITKLLRDYGAEGVSWIDNFQTGAVQLTFAVGREDRTLVKFQITPAAFKEEHRSWNAEKGHEEKVQLPNWARSMRLLEAWVKMKLESIAFGLTTIEQEFLAEMVVRDERGQEYTVGERLIPQIEAGDGRLSLPAPSPKHDDVIDASHREA